MSQLEIVHLLGLLEAEHGPAALGQALRRCRLAIARTAF